LWIRGVNGAGRSGETSGAREYGDPECDFWQQISGKFQRLGQKFWAANLAG